MKRKTSLLLLTAAVLALPSWPARAQTGTQPATLASPMELFIAFSRAQLATAGFTRQEAEVNDQRTVWWERGTGPTLVLIHGVADQAGTWFQVAPQLAESYRVLLIDLAGHGESAPATGPLPMTTVVAGFEGWLVTYATVEGAAPPILVGNSMGAWVAILAALHHPERVGRVVAINGGPLRPDTGGLDLLPADREEARQLMAALRDPASPPTPDPVLDDLVRRAQNGHVSRMFAANDDLESHLLEGRLGEVKTPVDVLWGESDRYLGRAFADRLLAGLPNARLTLIPQCGHLPQAECPARFLERLKEVLASAPPAGGAPVPAAEESRGTPEESPGTDG